jgi:hypothetical protein
MSAQNILSFAAHTRALSQSAGLLTWAMDWTSGYNYHEQKQLHLGLPINTYIYIFVMKNEYELCSPEAVPRHIETVHFGACQGKCGIFAAGIQVQLHWNGSEFDFLASV